MSMGETLEVPSNSAYNSDSESPSPSTRTSIWADFVTTPHELFDIDKAVPIYEHNDSSQEHQAIIHDLLFNMFHDGKDELLVGKFLAGLENAGLKRSDQRLKELFENLRELLKAEEMNFRKNPNNSSGDFVGSIETLHVDRDTFADLILENIFVISAAFREAFVIPKFDSFCDKIEEIYYECKDISTGENAPYIKHLSKMDPNYWGCSICTIDGQRFSIGDTNIPITLHSLSKPLMYAIALNELGKDVVHKYVGQEPSGHNYNELVLDHNRRPHNPMINAGGIMVHSLLQVLARPELSLSDKFDLTHEALLKMTGGEYIGFNNSVFLEKKHRSDRNWALGHYMQEYKCFPKGSNLQDVMEYYLQTSSLESTCEVMSVAASTLANGGICPVTGEKALKGEVVADVLSLMQTCGMFEYSGKFAFKVGLPAKSSISGIIMLVVPNVCGITVWSPSLDSFNNSAKGVSFCEKLVNVFNFHLYDSIINDTHKVDPTKKRIDTKASNTISLLFAAGSGDMNTIVRLHLSGLDMGLYDCDGRTALHLASCENRFEVAEYLLVQCGVNPERRDRWGNTPLDEAKHFRSKPVLKLLRDWEWQQKLKNEKSKLTN